MVTWDYEEAMREPLKKEPKLVYVPCGCIVHTKCGELQQVCFMHSYIGRRCEDVN